MDTFHGTTILSVRRGRNVAIGGDGQVTLGAIIVKRLIADAEAFGYLAMRLDSGPFMTSAHKLYEAEGFRDRTAYEGAEVPAEVHHNWRFMERRLGRALTG